MKRIVLISGLIFLAILFLCNLIVGAVRIPLAEVWNILWGGTPEKSAWGFIVLESRLPQALTALVGGASLAITGLMLQTAFRNPLAGPGVFGVNSGASLGVALVMLAGGGSISAAGTSIGGFVAVLAAAFAGAMVVMMAILLASWVVKSNTMLLIVGIMTGYLASSAISLLNYFAGKEGVQSYMLWGMGNFGNVPMSQFALFFLCCLVGIIAALLLIKPLNALQLGEAYARNLGVSPLRMRNLLLAVTGWLTAVVTAWCGPISFIGLAVPHIARLFLKTDDHLYLMPGTLIAGATVGLLCNLICIIPGEAGLLPLNATTPLVGAPVIIYVILKSSRR